MSSRKLTAHLTAVFNMVDYDLLTHQLANVGIRGVALQWLISIPHGWGQRIVL